MTLYTLRVILFPNPPFFEGDREVWREIHIDDSHTLEDLHNAIFEAFDRWDQHLYEFDTYNEYELPTRAYVHPSQYEGGPSWPPMNEDEIDRMLDQMSMDNPPEGPSSISGRPGRIRHRKATSPTRLFRTSTWRKVVQCTTSSISEITGNTVSKSEK